MKPPFVGYWRLAVHLNNGFEKGQLVLDNKVWSLLLNIFCFVTFSQPMESQVKIRQTQSQHWPSSNVNVQSLGDHLSSQLCKLFVLTYSVTLNLVNLPEGRVTNDCHYYHYKVKILHFLGQKFYLADGVRYSHLYTVIYSYSVHLENCRSG